MTSRAYKGVVLILLLAIVVLLACIMNLVYKENSQRVEIQGVWSLIADYDRMRGHLGEISVTDAVDYLNITVHAKFGGATHDLNNILERERTKMVQDILSDLRKKTGEDLGSDPEKWIKNYSQPSTSASPNLH
jgi:hypothetical protein